MSGLWLGNWQYARSKPPLKWACPVCYKGAKIGSYLADLVVEGKIVIELKCVETFTNEHIAQCLNYLKASNLRLALLFNFQHPKVAWKRLIL